MIIEFSDVVANKKIAENIYLLTVKSPKIAALAKPAQFCNIKVSESSFPLLRRPFSISNINGVNISFMFNVVGAGTKILSEMKIGETIDMLGPLGKGFNFNTEYDLAVLVAGGLGIAPFPFLTKELKNKKIVKSFIGAKNKREIITLGMENISFATDDGSKGFNGNVIDLFKQEFQSLANKKIKVFGCGPTPMLKALQDFSSVNKLECEISVESAMACGFGICQGCPIEKQDMSGYYLICKDGPVFNSEEIIL